MTEGHGPATLPATDASDVPETARTTCVVVGGGPAGLVLGLLLARAGVEVTVLEKHKDFLRDFRGDTVHPTTLGLLDDLGLFERFDALPQSRMTQVAFPTPDGGEVRAADFGRLPLKHRYIAMVPQWDLLNLLAEAGHEEPTFTLRTEHEVTGVLREGPRVTGVDYRTPTGSGRLLADLVVACDGRWSVVRRSLGLPVESFAVDFDVWWFRIPTKFHMRESLVPKLDKGRAAIAIPREGYLQVAYLGWKGSDAALRARGIEAFRAEIAELMPDMAGDVDGIASMDDVKCLSVQLDRLKRWHTDGALCIGDAAHAMSPMGGVGINLAVQDAVATARLIAEPLRRGVVGGPEGAKVLAQVQRRRNFPTVVVQAIQRQLHSRVVMPTLAGKITEPPQKLFDLVRRFPFLSALPAFVVGIGPRPEKAPSWARRSPKAG
jgi:2-polyprenyl-6-methoxyphenol hydroxylase-like FAD-dependent oxidoreductase